MGQKNILISSLSLLVVIFVINNPLLFGFCKDVGAWESGAKYCNYSSPLIDNLAESITFGGFALGFSVLLLSLITYKMHDEVFHAWWSLARWMVSVIVVATMLIQFVPKNGGFFNMDALIYLLVLAPLYAIFILGSVWKIFRKYRELKKTL